MKIYLKNQQQIFYLNQILNIELLTGIVVCLQVRIVILFLLVYLKIQIIILEKKGVQQGKMLNGWYKVQYKWIHWFGLAAGT